MPKTQTKEEIEADLRQLRHNELTGFANEVATDIIAVLNEPAESVIVGGMVLGAILGNSAVLDEEGVKTLFAEVFKKIEITARTIMTKRANLEAVARITGGGHSFEKSTPGYEFIDAVHRLRVVCLRHRLTMPTITFHHPEDEVWMAHHLSDMQYGVLMKFDPTSGPVIQIADVKIKFDFKARR